MICMAAAATQQTNSARLCLPTPGILRIELQIAASVHALYEPKVLTCVPHASHPRCITNLQYGEQLHPSASEAQLSGADADAPINADERRTDSKGRAKDGSRQLIGQKRGHDWDDGKQS